MTHDDRKDRPPENDADLQLAAQLGPDLGPGNCLSRCVLQPWFPTFFLGVKNYRGPERPSPP